MSRDSLEPFFRPRSIAVIGASRLPESARTAVLRSLLRAELDGPIMPVDPQHASLLGLLCHRSIEDLPLAPDLAILCGPARELAEQVESLARRGTRAAIVMSPASRAESAALRQAARRHGVRILGPDSSGVQVPAARLDASVMNRCARPGSIALISESGSVIAGMLSWAEARAVGFSHVVSCGDGLDVDLGDLLDYLATDRGVRALLLYLKSLADSRKFFSAARAFARVKPLIAIKPASGEGATAIVFPGGQVLPGVDPDEVYDVAIQRAGMLRARDIDELFDAAATLTHGRRPATGELVIVTNGGGPGDMALGTLIEGGGRTAPLAPATLARLAELAPGRGDGRVVDIGRDAPPRRYREVLQILLADPGAPSLLVMHTENALSPDEQCAAEVIDALRDCDRLVLACWLGADPAGSARRRFAEAGIASYVTPEKATRAFLRMVDYQRNQYLLSQTPSTAAPDKATAMMRARARDIVTAALEAGRFWLHEEEAALLLECYGIAAQPARLAAGPDHAVSVARALGFPVIVRLSMRPPPPGAPLDSEAAVRDAAAALFANPGAILAGMPEPRIVVQAAARRPDALILMAGIATDPVFGRVIHVGPGGLQKRIDEGGALSLPPLNMALAEEVIGRTRIADMVGQTFNRSRLDELALRSLLVRLSDMAVDLPELTLLQINPLLGDGDGVSAQDVHVAIEPALRHGGRPALAIRPYPGELEEELVLRDGSKVLARPVRAEDEPAYTELLVRTNPSGVPSRLGRVGHVPRDVALQLVHIDYDRQMTFVVPVSGQGGAPEIIAVIDTLTSPDNREAEYSILVRSDTRRAGLARALMAKMIRYCRSRGTQTLFGMVAKHDVPMLSLAFKLGFQPDLEGEHEDDLDVEKMTLRLS